MYAYKHTFLVSLAIIFFALLVSGFIISIPIYAQEDTIVFPVAELGNCESKEACHSYCDEPGNMPKCIAFAKAHNLMTQKEADIAEKFSDRFEEYGGGPGGCTTPSSCDAYCEDITHLNECLAFADDQGFHDEFVEEGQKIARYLGDGGRMPGGCTSRRSCEAYCSDFNNGEECLLFIENVGLEIHGGDRSNDINKKQLRVMIDLMNRGETPGGCTSERECEAYCTGEGHFEECIAFGEKVGFISPEEAGRIRKTGGKGPNGCSSRKECDVFCNNPNNIEQCFAFASEHGLIDENEIHNLEEGLGRLREVLGNAPEESLACLRHNLGDTIVSDIQSGTLSPGPEFAAKIEACLKRGFEEQGQREFGDMMASMPPEVRRCVDEKIDGNISEIFKQGDDHNRIEEIVKGCFESSFADVGSDSNFEEGFRRDFDEGVFHRVDEGRVFYREEERLYPSYPPTVVGESDFERTFERESIREGDFETTGLDGLSPEMKKCAIIQFGDDFETRLFSGKLHPEELRKGIDACLQKLFREDIQYEQTPQFEPNKTSYPTSVDGGTKVICTAEYAPVCGEKQVQCITAPCYPVRRTYSNECNLKVDRATFIHRGACENVAGTDSSTGTFDGTNRFEEFKAEHPVNIDGTIEDFETRSAIGSFLGSVFHAVRILFSR